MTFPEHVSHVPIGAQHQIELRQLRYFVAVADERHFHHAADLLGIAQPSLSQQIGRLERMLGTDLFVRGGRQIELTQAGQAFLVDVRQAIELASRAVEAVRAIALGNTGVLRIGTYALNLAPAAARLVQEFRSRFPVAEIRSCASPGNESLDALNERRVDVAILLFPFRSFASVDHLVLGTNEAVAVVPTSHRLVDLDPIPSRELQSEKLLVWPRRYNPELTDYVRKTFFPEVEDDRWVETSDIADALMRVQDGEGIAITHPRLAELAIPQLVFRRIDPPPRCDYGIVWLESAEEPLLKSFLNLARERASRVS